MKQVILGTAGHIDHGKTSLIKALTDIDTDRLKEEKARGITIELGFAHLKLPSGQLLGIVDVPGHEKFVKNMVAGATGIDIVALIIAADEGVMPQTKEHLEICQLLNVQSGIVVITKVDLVETDWLELVKEDVTEYLSGTFLEDAPLIEVSSATGEGIDDLLNAIDNLVEKIPEREAGNYFRLPVDRVFTMKGFGTVVTGTTVSGKISTGDEVTIYPQGLTSRIRGIQVHNKETSQVAAGLRTAINLQGAEKAQIQRGNVLAAKDSLKSTFMVDVFLELLPAVPRKLKNRAKARFHTGTSEIISTVVLLDREELKQGDKCFAQIRLDQPTAILQGDRFILRSYSPVRAIGGGKILNPLPTKKKRFSDPVLKELEILNSGTLQERIETFAKMGRFQGMQHGDLQFLTNTTKKHFDNALKTLLAQGKMVQYSKEPGIFVHKEYFEKAKDEIVSTLSRYHQDFPLKAGLIKEELRSKTMGSRNQRLFNFIISKLINDNVISQEKELLRLKGHSVTLAEDQKKISTQIEEIYQKSGLQPPYFKEVKNDFSKNEGSDVLEVMLKEGLLIKVKEDLFFHHDSLDDLKIRLIKFLKENGELNTSQFKEMTGVSRKYAIPLMEYFDRLGLTVRIGDNRVLRNKE
jgi:selenocysteine-specific elongation factor